MMNTIIDCKNKVINRFSKKSGFAERVQQKYESKSFKDSHIVWGS